VRLAIEGTAPELIKSSQTLSKDVTHDEQEVAARFWEDFGTVAPTVGIIGAVIGLIQVMENLDKAEMIGPGIAVAFTATLYGVGAANLLFLPIAKKLKRKFSDEATAREMVILGMEAILSGTSPKMINETLLPFCRLPEGTEGGDEEGGDSKKKKK
jgi:chemotaxis protein MotA